MPRLALLIIIFRNKSEYSIIHMLDPTLVKKINMHITYYNSYHNDWTEINSSDGEYIKQCLNWTFVALSYWINIHQFCHHSPRRHSPSCKWSSFLPSLHLVSFFNTNSISPLGRNRLNAWIWWITIIISLSTLSGE